MQNRTTTISGARRTGPDCREGEDGEREHRHCVDHAEGHDRDGDRLEPDPNAAEPAQGGDLDDVVEPERQDDSAGRSRPARRETPRAVGPLGGSGTAGAMPNARKPKLAR